MEKAVNKIYVKARKMSLSSRFVLLDKANKQLICLNLLIHASKISFCGLLLIWDRINKAGRTAEQQNVLLTIFCWQYNYIHCFSSWLYKWTIITILTWQIFLVTSIPSKGTLADKVAIKCCCAGISHCTWLFFKEIVFAAEVWHTIKLSYEGDWFSVC